MFVASSALADSLVGGHIRKDGSYVQPHHRTKKDSTTYNNYSTKPNQNPYTGKKGTRDPYQVGAPKKPKKGKML
jgi:hypothetical protein